MNYLLLHTGIDYQINPSWYAVAKSKHTA